MTMLSARRRFSCVIASLALTGLAASVGLTGCGGSTTSNNPTAPPSSKAAVKSAPSSADPHAGWTVAKLGNGQFELPPGWSVQPGSGQLALEAPKGNYLAKPGAGTFASNTTPRANTNADVPGTLALFKGMQLSKIKRLPDVTLGGVVFYHVQAQSNANWFDMFGTVRNGYLVHVLWRMTREFIDRNAATKLINQVMTTFKPL